MKKFTKEYPPTPIGAEISKKSFETIRKELKHYPKSNSFSRDELDIIIRLIHTSSCFDEVLNNIYFSKNSLSKIQELLKKELDY